MSNATRQVLKDASWEVDNPRRGGFDPSLVHRHGLRRRGQSIDDAAREAREWIRENQNKARNAKTPKEQAQYFGYALHTVLDMTSPSHDGYQVWTDIGSGNPIKLGMQVGDWIVHAGGESLMNAYRQGLAVGAAIRLFKDTFGTNNYANAIGYEPGSNSDPSIRELERRCDMTGASCTERERGEMLYQYRIGLSHGLNFDWENQTQRMSR